MQDSNLKGSPVQDLNALIVYGKLQSPGNGLFEVRKGDKGNTYKFKEGRGQTFQGRLC